MGLQPRMISTGVIGHPVDQYLHFLFVYFFYQGFPVIQGAVLRIDPGIISHCIVAAQCSFPVFFTDRIDRHKPDGLYAHFF